jgi:hypothetical protein
MRRRRLVPVFAFALLVVVPLAACGGDDSGSSSDAKAPSSTTTEGSGTEVGGGSCGDLEAGKDGVIRTFCDGPAFARITLGGTESTLSGGECTDSGGYYTINFGTVVGGDFTGSTHPDYLGALFPDEGGSPEAVTIRVGGKGGLVNGATGNVSVDKESVHLEGTTQDGTAVSADIGCKG